MGGGAVVIGEDNMRAICPPPVGLWLTDLPNIGRANGPPGSGITVKEFRKVKVWQGGIMIKKRENYSKAFQERTISKL